MQSFARPLHRLALALVIAALPAIAAAQPKPVPPAAGQPVTGAPQPPPLPAPTPQPPPLPTPVEVTYFYALNGAQAGPVPAQQLLALITAGTITRQTLVWTPGMAAWRPAAEVAELTPLLAAMAPPLPAGENFRQLILGTWMVTENNPAGFTRTTEVRYTADGLYTGVITTIFQGLMSPVPVSGRWSITVLEGQRFALTLTPNSGIPSTSTIRVMDQMTLFNETENYEVRRRG